MKYLFRTINFLLLLFIVSACDEIPLDKIEHEGSVIPKRKVLVEYFTGHDCINCPGRSKPAFHELDLLYGQNVVVMAIHAGWFAEPFLTPDNLDLNSSIGTKLFETAGVQGVPTGRVDRKMFNNQTLLDPAIWSTAATSYIAQQSPVTIDLTITPLASDSVLKFKASTQFVLPINQQLLIESYLVEDSIVGFQTAPTDIPDYVFMSVLRTDIKTKEDSNVLNAQSTVSAGTIINKEFELSLKGKAWKTKHCSVIIVISDATTGECLQTEKTKISN